MSYVVRSNDLAAVVDNWRALQGPQNRVFNYKPNLFTYLNSPEFQRIQWFYYCDDRDGLTIRVYDRAFRQQHLADYVDANQYVVLRGEHLGTDGNDVLKGQYRNAFVKAEAATRKALPNMPHVRTDFFEHRNNAQILGPRGGHEPGLETMELRQLLKQFGQVILYGPPGTGKTRLARQLAFVLLRQDVQDNDIDLNEADVDLFLETEVDRPEPRFGFVVFHPAYEYEQFVGGIVPRPGDDGRVQFSVEAGTFLKLCRRACANENENFVLIIDEINRGHLPKLLGELVFALEYRGRTVPLAFTTSKETWSSITVPTNLFVIATMNSSDRSIGHIDVAIRRRFALHLVGPNTEVIERKWADHVMETRGRQLAELMTTLNAQLQGDGQDSELGVGHSYFIPTAEEEPWLQVQAKWKHQVRQLLAEYSQLTNRAIGLASCETLEAALAALPPQGQQNG
jgi:MoxR-like ATPase